MKAYSLDLRQKILKTYRNQEGSIRQVARRFKVARSFVQKLLKQERIEGNIAPLPHGGGLAAKLDCQVELLKQLLEEKNDATLIELCEKLKEKTGIQISQSTLCRFLKKHNLTRKKTLHVTKAESERVQNQREDYWQVIQSVEAENLIFIDEMGVNLALTRTHARSLKGTRERWFKSLSKRK